jgi:hypothetical protein
VLFPPQILDAPLLSRSIEPCFKHNRLCSHAIIIYCRRSEGAIPTAEVRVVLGENGSCEVATDADTALERLIMDQATIWLEQAVASSGSTSQCLSLVTVMTTTK